VNKYNPEIFTKVVKAGRRTYYFDVRPTKNTSELYITITEKKRNEEDSEKFKIFLYKEDFEKFLNALQESISFAKNNEHKKI
jgi:hypothetical protein